MPILEETKKILEHVTGYGRPTRGEVANLVRTRKPQLFWFRDDGSTPNNPKLPFIHYRTPVRLIEQRDTAAIFEELFAMNGWRDAWRDGVYDFLHFHTRTHEVLGIARGAVRTQFGGVHGRTIQLKAGDVAILPAGTGHKRLAASRDLLVVGAYPASGKYDEPKPAEVEHDKAVAAIAKVPVPAKDPVYGKEGPLLEHWRHSSPH
jgi:uncharacterized protein YjlB